jgi:hypothetical protein
MQTMRRYQLSMVLQLVNSHADGNQIRSCTSFSYTNCNKEPSVIGS